MDRSFLSDPDVVAASRSYVCVRPATYENAEEVPFLASLFRGRSGALENTVFALLSSDGKTPISAGGRSPQMAFRTDDNARIIRQLQGVAAKYPVKETKAPDRLPLAQSLRMGLNVAACDNQPLILCLADDRDSLRKIERALAEHAWSDQFQGLYHYGASSKSEAGKKVDGITIPSGIVVVKPDQFGIRGTVLLQHAVGDASKTLLDTLAAGLEKFDRQSHDDTRMHVRQGKQSGVHWETATPVTDPGRPPGRRR